jgi:HSP20 family molecular chaperone IbpA
LDGYENRRIVLLDSAGLETPVLKNNKELKLKRRNTKTEEDEIKEKDHFKEKSREKLITELFLQNYIINNSDILIIVVGILTYSEQKLLNRIRTEFLKARNSKNKVQKPLFIIHNLMTYTTIEQVEEYIEDFLLKSATFDLAVGHKISTKEEEKTGTYYYETIKTQKIFHLIFAQEGSDAGNHYNNLTLDFLENSYQNVTNLTNFDVIETIKDSFVEISKDILEKTENPITKESFENSNNSIIKISSKTNGVTLKKCLIDELGFSNLKGNGFEPTYNCYKKGNKIIVRVEVSGNKELKASQEHNSSYNMIKVEGEKKKDKEPEKDEDIMFSNREFGKFSLDIPLSPEFCIKNTRPKIEDKKGLVIIEFELEESLKTAELISKDEEDV